jgi:hypothetical protein
MKMILRKLTTVLLTAFLVLIIGSEAKSQDLSGNAGAFADIGLGLRPLGMGGAYTALATDENAARWNPAGLSVITDPSSGFTWTNQFDEIGYNYLSISYPQIKGIGVGGYVISSGDDVYSEMTIGLGAGVTARKIKIPVDNVHFGMSFKYLSTSYGNDEAGGIDRVTGSSAGVSLDFGVLYFPTDDISLALVLRDFVNGISWDSSYLDNDTTQASTYSEGLPRKAILSLGWELEKATIAFEYLPGLYTDVKDRIAMGVEVVILKVLRPRFGIAQNLTSGYINQWMTAGLGVSIKHEKLGPIRYVNFGYTHMLHEVASTPRVGLSLGW